MFLLLLRKATQEFQIPLACTHMHMDRSSHLLSLAPQEQGGNLLRVDPLGGVHYEGDSEDSGDESHAIIIDRQVSLGSADAEASKSNISVRFLPATYMRPKLVAEESRIRYAPTHVAHAVCSAFFQESLVVVFGGADGAVPSNATWLYHIQAKKWECLNNPGEHIVTDELRSARRAKGFTTEVFPPPRCGHCAATIGDVKPLQVENQAEPSTASPLGMTSTQALTETHADVVSESTLRTAQKFKYEPLMIVFGGANLLQGFYFSDLWAFDVLARAWRELHPAGTAPSPRWHCTAVSLEQRVFIFGGESTTYSLLNDIHVYDNESNMWRDIRVVVPVPPPRMMHAAARVGGDKMLVVGGIGSATLSDAWVLELRTLLWRRVGDYSRLSPHSAASDRAGAAGQKLAIEGHVLIPFDNIAILHGGRIGRQFSSAVWAFNVVTEQWSPIGEVSLQENRSCPQARWQHCACALREASVTRGTKMMLTLDQLHQQRIHLTDDVESKEYLEQAAVELTQQIAFEGSLSVEGNTPVMSHTVCGFVFGGSGYPRNFSDMWKVELVDPAASTLYQSVKGLQGGSNGPAAGGSSDDPVKLSERLLFPEGNSQLYAMSQGAPVVHGIVGHGSMSRQSGPLPHKRRK